MSVFPKICCVESHTLRKSSTWTGRTTRSFPIVRDRTRHSQQNLGVLSETAIDAVESGVRAAVILDGRIPHVLLLELFTEHGAGTLIEA